MASVQQYPEQDLDKQLLFAVLEVVSGASAAARCFLKLCKCRTS
jgi:hypothetical protein